MFRKHRGGVTQGQGHGPGEKEKVKPLVNLVVVSCGTERLEEAVTMIKSAIIFSHGSKLRLYAFTDYETLPKFTQYVKRTLLLHL